MFDKEVIVEGKKIDRYERTLGRVLVCEEDTCQQVIDANLEQIKDGLAWHFKKYEKEQPIEEREQYATAEGEAREKGVGLWSDTQPTPPWEFRHRKQ